MNTKAKAEVEKIKKYVADHPDAAFPEAKKALGLTVSDVTYYKYRLKYRNLRPQIAKLNANAASAKEVVPGGVNHRQLLIDKAASNKKIRTDVFEQMSKIIPTNPSICYAEYKRTHGCGVTGTTFKKYKDTILMGATPGPKRKNVYMSVFTTDQPVTEPAKKLLKDFVNALNVANRTRMEVVEYADPKILEVRELT